MQDLRLNLNSGTNLNLNMSSRSPLNLQLREGSGGTKDYNDLYNKPQIEGVTLQGNKTYEELNMNRLTNIELEAILQ